MRKSTLNEITDVITKIAPSYPVISIDLFGLKQDIEDKLSLKVDIVAGPLHKETFLTINKRIRVYEV